MTTPTLPLALGTIPSGLFILTVRNDSSETGMLVSWVMQAGFDPPMVSLALRQGRYLVDWLKPETPIVLNQLGVDQKQLLSHFGRGFEESQPAFEGLLTKSWRDVRVLSDAAAHLECVVRGHVDSGDHRIFLAEVVGGETHSDVEPWVHIRKNGLRY